MSQETNEPVKAFTRFRDAARCGSFRRDGRLLVAGSDEGHVRLFDVNNKALLRVFKAHHRYRLSDVLCLGERRFCCQASRLVWPASRVQRMAGVSGGFMEYERAKNQKRNNTQGQSGNPEQFFPTVDGAAKNRTSVSIVVFQTGVSDTLPQQQQVHHVGVRRQVTASVGYPQ